MKTVSLEKVEELIEKSETNIQILKEEKENLIQRNVVEINELIQKKLKEISETIKAESIKEICGKDLEFIESSIEKEIDTKQLLESLICDEEDETYESDSETSYDTEIEYSDEEDNE